MGEYGCGITLSQSFMYDKERIKKALAGQLMCDETEDGFVYADASKEECDKYIIDAFDNAVHHALQLAHAGRAYDKILENHKIKRNSVEFMKAMMATTEDSDYKFDCEETIQ